MTSKYFKPSDHNKPNSKKGKGMQQRVKTSRTTHKINNHKAKNAVTCRNCFSELGPIADAQVTIANIHNIHLIQLKKSTPNLGPQMFDKKLRL